VPNYTEVAQKGTYSAEAQYTPQDVAHIVSYAGEVRYFFRLPDNKQHSHIYGIIIYSEESMFSWYVVFWGREGCLRKESVLR
jgi:hypothetical protein